MWAGASKGQQEVRPCSLQCLSQGEDRKAGNTARAEAGKLGAPGVQDGPRLDAEEMGRGSSECP